MRSILFKYIVQDTIKYFFIVLAAVIGIYIAVEFFEKIDNFYEVGLPLTRAVYYFSLKLPLMVAQVMPVCILLAVIISLGLMNKNNEIIALRSGGIGVYYILFPVLFVGFMACIFQFMLSETIVPISYGEANKIWIGEIKRQSLVVSREKNIWIRGNGKISHIKYYNADTGEIFGVTLNKFDINFNIVERVDAQKGVFKQGRWFLNDIMQQNLDKEEGNYKVAFHEEKVEDLGFLPDDLKHVIKKSEEMNFIELLKYVRKVEAEGYNPASYRVDLYAKFANPFICIILCMVGVGIAIKKGIHEDMPANIVYGIGAAFLYFISYSFCLSLGYGEMLPPLVAVIVTNFIFLCIGAFMLLNAD